MNLIEATKDHIWVIQTLSGEAWPHTFKDLLSPEQIAYMMDMMYSTPALEKQMDELGHHYILAKEGDEYLGYLSYEVDYKSKPWTKIHKIYVLPSAQGKGVGRVLIEKAKEIALANNNLELSLNVNRDNEKAIRFYKHMGFEIILSEDIDIGSGFLMTDHVLNKKL